MARLLTVVNERKKLRSEYRMHLEQEYIKECKAQEQEELKARNEEALKKGEKITPDEQTIKRILADKKKKQKQLINHVREEMIEKYESTLADDSQSMAAPLLDETDITFVA